MRVPFGKKGLVAGFAAITGAVFFWRVRARRREEAEAREWEAEIAGAVDEGRAAGSTGAASTSEPSTA
jgi:hypothetical protein